MAPFWFKMRKYMTNRSALPCNGQKSGSCGAEEVN